MFKILGKSKDLRTDTNIIYCQCNIVSYLKLVGNDFDDFEIQRKRQEHKAYRRMRDDIISGAQLPTITLAVKSQFVKDVLDSIDDNDRLIETLTQPDCVNILDGLQRTFILYDLNNDTKIEFKEDQNLLLEFWVESEIKHLMYRLIVLNAGQKPMSLRHQIELIFMTLKDKIENDIPDLDIMTERDASRRTRAMKFSLENIVSAFMCFINKSHELDKENIIAKQLIEESLFDLEESKINDEYIDFIKYFKIYSQLDQMIFSHYNNHIPSESHFLANDNTLKAFFAAVGEFHSRPNMASRIEPAITSLIDKLGEFNNENNDILGLEYYKELQKGFDSKKRNIGFSSRKLLCGAFKEFFRESGEKNFADCLQSEVV